MLQRYRYIDQYIQHNKNVERECFTLFILIIEVRIIYIIKLNIHIIVKLNEKVAMKNIKLYIIGTSKRYIDTFFAPAIARQLECKKEN